MDLPFEQFKQFFRNCSLAFNNPPTDLTHPPAPPMDHSRALKLNRQSPLLWIPSHVLDEIVGLIVEGEENLPPAEYDSDSRQRAWRLAAIRSYRLVDKHWNNSIGFRCVKAGTMCFSHFRICPVVPGHLLRNCHSIDLTLPRHGEWDSYYIDSARWLPLEPGMEAGDLVPKPQQRPQVPEGLIQIPGLEHLRLRAAGIQELPAWLNQLPLKTLRVDFGPPRRNLDEDASFDILVPGSPLSTSLRKLTLYGSGPKGLPECLHSSLLTDLNLSGLGYHAFREDDLPFWLGNLPLVHLDLSGTGVQRLPATFHTNTTLRTIVLHHTDISLDLLTPDGYVDRDTVEGYWTKASVRAVHRELKPLSLSQPLIRFQIATPTEIAHYKQKSHPRYIHVLQADFTLPLVPNPVFAGQFPHGPPSFNEFQQLCEDAIFNAVDRALPSTSLKDWDGWWDARSAIDEDIQLELHTINDEDWVPRQTDLCDTDDDETENNIPDDEMDEEHEQDVAAANNQMLTQ